MISAYKSPDLGHRSKTMAFLRCKEFWQHDSLLLYFLVVGIMNNDVAGIASCGKVLHLNIY